MRRQFSIFSLSREDEEVMRRWSPFSPQPHKFAWLVAVVEPGLCDRWR
jgi:hypothetical protein